MNERTTIQVGDTTWSDATPDEILADIAECTKLIGRNKDKDDIGAVLVNPGEKPLKSFLESKGIQVDSSPMALPLSFCGIPVILDRRIKVGQFLPVPKRLIPDGWPRVLDSVGYRLASDAPDEP